jgi:uncharacterized protein (DUF427 family)
MDMQTEGTTLKDAAWNWDLPVEAIEEIVRYCESHADLLDWEAKEEKGQLMSKVISLSPLLVAG